MTSSREQGFSLIELLVVIVVLGILAAIAIPRFLEQRQAAWNSAAIADLRNLVAVETSLEATETGLTEDPVIIADQGWATSLPEVVVCADVLGDGTDALLAAWHVSGSALYTWRRSDPRVQVTTGSVPATCAAALPGGDPTRVSP